MSSTTDRAVVVAEMIEEEESAIAELRQQISEREMFITRLRDRMGAVAHTNGAQTREAAPPGDTLGLEAPPRPSPPPVIAGKRAYQRTRPPTLPDLMVEEMRKTTEPITVPELARRIVANHPEYAKKKLSSLKSNIVTTIGRNERVFVKLDIGLYQLQESHGEAAQEARQSARAE